MRMTVASLAIVGALVLGGTAAGATPGPDEAKAAGGLDYQDGRWTWGGRYPLSSAGECPEEDSCYIDWTPGGPVVMVD